ncbi:START domain-containing protein [Cognaticolwellia aestuarii]|uniref:START domain-containing protein n=1 Tax=Cognaticolwellia aestuarii TaxID=329993 RepID=UPI0013010BEB|nr:START domain-containing protein [Cognaticolwellia aestuarii]
MNKQTKKTSAATTLWLLTVLFGLFSLSSLAAENNSQSKDKSKNESWQVWRQDAELKVSYRTSQYNDLLEIKAQAQVASSLAGFMYFLEDLALLPVWLDNAESAKIINQITANENIFITRFKGLWPVSAREMVVHSHYWQNDNLSVEIAVKDASDSIIATKNTIRMQVLKAHWLVVPTKNSQIAISYQFIVDPKGNIPQWLTKPMTLNGIWTTLNNIREQLPNSPWQQKSRADIQEWQ